MATKDRVRANTDPKMNRRIDREMEARIRWFSNGSASEISRRLGELEQEWDIERWLQANASTIALTGVLLGAFRSRKWLVIPGIVLPFLFQHATQGWCPPLAVFRAMGVRTRREIDREKYALKLLRGDFDASRYPTRTEAALAAARPG